MSRASPCRPAPAIAPRFDLAPRAPWRVAVLALALLFPLSCGRSPSPPTVSGVAADSEPRTPAPRDAVREPVVDEAERAAPRLRIASAAPSVTEICCALGLREQLVARTDYCDYPPGIEAVESIGSLIKVNGERLLSLRPDIVLVSGASRFQTERLNGLRLNFASVPDNRLDDLYASIREIGAHTGRPRSAERLCEALRTEVAAALASGRAARPTRVLITVGALGDPPRPPFAAGPGTFYDDILRAAGYENVATSAGAAFAPLGLEFIVRSDPDVIIELDDDGRQRQAGASDALRAWARVGALKAVRERRVVPLVGAQHYRLGPRLPATVRALLDAAGAAP